MIHVVPETSALWSAYRVESFPHSDGRALLGEALATYTMLQDGIGPMDIAKAFAPGGDAQDRQIVLMAVDIIGRALLTGRFTTYARPIGGGEPVRLDPGVWELDDFTHRFATCGIDPRRPFDLDSPATHRIFIDRADIEAIYDVCCSDIPQPTPARASRNQKTIPDDAGLNSGVMVVGDPATDRLLRLPEVEGMVGMKRSTIYSRIADGRFPEPVKNGSRIAAWRESDVRAWLEKIDK